MADATRFIGRPIEVFRVTDSVYGDQARHDFERYTHETLAASQHFGGRFNQPGDFGAIYTSFDEDTAWREAASRFAREGIDGLPPDMSLLRIVVSAGRFVDFRDAEVRMAWDVELEALTTANETDEQRSLCWNVGRNIRALADALAVKSARATGTNFPVFPGRTDSELQWSLASSTPARVPREFAQQVEDGW